ncbi:heat shock protein beta-1 [Chanos chanos]|uniref:Heat shock protein beta-1 n=1 Tax=Chanos chanos TaxID=29144 RepID=A0A6J2WTK9_CHACN|nr:heat shock protein beta-1-like [Chanos chanos]
MVDSACRPQYSRDATWYPLTNWCQPSLLFSQHFGMPPFLEPGDFNWLAGIFRRVGASSWPGYMRVPRFATVTQVPLELTPKVERELSGGVSQVRADEYKWKITLDVNHFAPTDISIRTQDGFLEIEGKHEERGDEHGYITRCFTRKYKLPIGIATESIRSTVTGDGILIVEAPLPTAPSPANIIIPVQVEKETSSAEGGRIDVPGSEENVVRETVSEEQPGAAMEASQSTGSEETKPEEEGGVMGGGPADVQTATRKESEEKPEPSISATISGTEEGLGIREKKEEDVEREPSPEAAQVPATPPAEEVSAGKPDVGGETAARAEEAQPGLSQSLQQQEEYSPQQQLPVEQEQVEETK